jgi:hypothetical protein
LDGSGINQRQAVVQSEFGNRCRMTNNNELLHSYAYALFLSLMFQLSAWVMCFLRGCRFEHEPPAVSGAVLINLRVWFISCSLYWLGFLAVFFTQREKPSVWRVLYTGLAFPALLIAAALLVP